MLTHAQHGAGDRRVPSRSSPTSSTGSSRSCRCRTSTQQAVELYLTLDLGADILYVRSRNPRVVFEAIREHRMSAMFVFPQVLDLFWTAARARGRAPGQGRRGSGGPERSPGACRWAPGAWSSGQRPRPARRRACGSSSRPGRSSRPRSSRPGRTSASSSCRATAPPRREPGPATPGTTTRSGRSAGRCPASRCGSPTTARSSSAARPSPRATGRIRRRQRRPSPTTASTGPATSAISTPQGRLVLHGRKRDMIVLPNGLNVFPEDIENALRVAGIRDSVVLETEPGRIEAIVAGPEHPPARPGGRGGRAGGRSVRTGSRPRSGSAPRSTRR